MPKIIIKTVPPIQPAYAKAKGSDSIPMPSNNAMLLNN